MPLLRHIVTVDKADLIILLIHKEVLKQMIGILPQILGHLSVYSILKFRYFLIRHFFQRQQVIQAYMKVPDPLPTAKIFFHIGDILLPSLSLQKRRHILQ